MHGNDLVLRLLEAGYTDVVVAVASYADPVAVVATAEDLGYRVVNFLAMGLDYGPYSSEPKVAEHIRGLVAEGRDWAGELLSALQLPGRALALHPAARTPVAVQQRVASPPSPTAAAAARRGRGRQLPAQPVAVRSGQHPVAGQLEQRGVQPEHGVGGQHRLHDPASAPASSATCAASAAVSSPRISRSRICSVRLPRTTRAIAATPSAASGEPSPLIAATTKPPAAAVTDCPAGRRGPPPAAPPGPAGRPRRQAPP